MKISNLSVLIFLIRNIYSSLLGWKKESKSFIKFYNNIHDERLSCYIVEKFKNLNPIVDDKSSFKRIVVKRDKFTHKRVNEILETNKHRIINFQINNFEFEKNKDLEIYFMPFSNDTDKIFMYTNLYKENINVDVPLMFCILTPYINNHFSIEYDMYPSNINDFFLYTLIELQNQFLDNFDKKRVSSNLQINLEISDFCFLKAYLSYVNVQTVILSPMDFGDILIKIAQIINKSAINKIYMTILVDSSNFDNIYDRKKIKQYCTFQMSKQKKSVTFLDDKNCFNDRPTAIQKYYTSTYEYKNNQKSNHNLENKFLTLSNTINQSSFLLRTFSAILYDPYRKIKISELIFYNVKSYNDLLRKAKKYLKIENEIYFYYVKDELIKRLDSLDIENIKFLRFFITYEPLDIRNIKMPLKSKFVKGYTNYTIVINTEFLNPFLIFKIFANTKEEIFKMTLDILRQFVIPEKIQKFTSKFKELINFQAYNSLCIFTIKNTTNFKYFNSISITHKIAIDFDFFDQCSISCSDGVYYPAKLTANSDFNFAYENISDFVMLYINENYNLPQPENFNEINDLSNTIFLNIKNVNGTTENREKVPFEIQGVVFKNTISKFNYLVKIKKENEYYWVLCDRKGINTKYSINLSRIQYLILSRIY